MPFRRGLYGVANSEREGRAIERRGVSETQRGQHCHTCGYGISRVSGQRTESANKLIERQLCVQDTDSISLDA